MAEVAVAEVVSAVAVVDMAAGTVVVAVDVDAVVIVGIVAVVAVIVEIAAIAGSAFLLSRPLREAAPVVDVASHPFLTLDATASL